MSKQIACIVLVVWSISVTDAAASDPANTANAYIQTLRTGSPGEATRFWDAEETLLGAFGLSFAMLSPEEQRRAEKAFLKFIELPYANPKIKDLFKTIKPEQVAVRKVEDDLCMVGIIIVGDEGRFRSKNYLMLKKSAAGNWKLVDQRHAKQMSVRVALSTMYASGRKNDSDTIASVLEQAIGN